MVVLLPPGREKRKPPCRNMSKAMAFRGFAVYKVSCNCSSFQYGISPAAFGMTSVGSQNPAMQFTLVGIIKSLLSY